MTVQRNHAIEAIHKLQDHMQTVQDWNTNQMVATISSDLDNGVRELQKAQKQLSDIQHQRRTVENELQQATVSVA